MGTLGGALVLRVRDAGGRAVAHCAAEGGIVEVPLTGGLDLDVAAERGCVGRVDEGRHVPCPGRPPVSPFAQCSACMGVEDPACIFEPRCARDPSACSCLSTFRAVPHVVYLAFHGVLPKVGMTQARRVGARLREQGADAWMLVQPHAPGDPATPLDRAQARAVERQVAFLHGVPEWRSHRETLPQLARPVPWPNIEQRAEGWRERLAGRHDVQPGLHRIEDHPLPQPLGGVPVRAQAAGRHRGRWVGLKGQHLVYEAAPSARRLGTGMPAFVALRTHDLEGRVVRGLDC